MTEEVKCNYNGEGIIESIVYKEILFVRDVPIVEPTIEPRIIPSLTWRTFMANRIDNDLTSVKVSLWFGYVRDKDIGKKQYFDDRTISWSFLVTRSR